MNRLNMLYASAVIILLCSGLYGGEANPSPTVALVTLQDSSGRKRFIPRPAAQRSKVFARQLEEGAPSLTCDDSVQLSDISSLFWGLYQYTTPSQKNLSLDFCNDQVREIFIKYCSEFKGSEDLLPVDKNYTMFTQKLVEMVSYLETLRCKPLRKAMACMCALLFNDPVLFYEKLLKKNAHKSAYNFAHYAFLLKTDVLLNETRAQITLDRNFLRQLFASTHALEFPKGAVTFSLQDYKNFKPELLRARVRPQSANFQKLMLCDIEGLSTLEQASTLESLNLAENYLQIFPTTALTALLQLRRLNLAYNQLENVASLSDLTSLQELDLSHNQLTTLEGAGLAQLTSLQQLDVSHNQLPAAPEWTTRLRSVNLADNTFNRE